MNSLEQLREACAKVKHLEAAMHKCWSAQTNESGDHAYNKTAWLDFQEIMRRTVKTIDAIDLSQFERGDKQEEK